MAHYKILRYSKNVAYIKQSFIIGNPQPSIIRKNMKVQRLGKVT